MDEEKQKKYPETWINFQYALFFTTLYISFISLAGILHIGINKLIFPPVSISSPYSLDNTLLQWYIAGILVAYPIFAILYLLINSQTTKNPEIKHLKSKEIFVYLTLIGTSLIMVTQFISTIYGFLNGEDILRSLSHLGITFLVAGSLFLSYIYQIITDKK